MAGRERAGRCCPARQSDLLVCLEDKPQRELNHTPVWRLTQPPAGRAVLHEDSHGRAHRYCCPCTSSADGRRVGTCVRHPRYVAESEVAGAVSIAVNVAEGLNSNRLATFSQVGTRPRPAAQETAHNGTVALVLRQFIYPGEGVLLLAVDTGEPSAGVDIRLVKQTPRV